MPLTENVQDRICCQYTFRFRLCRCLWILDPHRALMSSHLVTCPLVLNGCKVVWNLWKWCTVQGVHSAQCTVCSAQCAVHTAHCTLHTPRETASCLLHQSTLSTSQLRLHAISSNQIKILTQFNFTTWKTWMLTLWLTWIKYALNG